MTLFISYANADSDAVRVLAQELESGGHSVWVDDDLRGGDAWWPTILERIRACSVFLLALSDRSLNSEPCQAERDYARTLGKRLLPVQVGVVSNLRTGWLSEFQVVDYRDSSRSAGIALMSAVAAGVDRPTDLPDPLPPPPPIPYAYLMVIGEQVRSREPLSPVAQIGLVEQLTEAFRRTEDAGVRQDVVSLARIMRNRPELTQRSAGEIATLIDVPVPEPPMAPDPPPGRRWSPADSAATAAAVAVVSPLLAIPQITLAAGVFAVGFSVQSIVLGQPGAWRNMGIWLAVSVVCVVVAMGSAGWLSPQ